MPLMLYMASLLNPPSDIMWLAWKRVAEIQERRYNGDVFNTNKTGLLFVNFYQIKL